MFKEKYTLINIMEFKQKEKEIILYNKVPDHPKESPDNTKESPDHPKKSPDHPKESPDRPKDKFKYFEMYILKVLKQYSNNSINRKHIFACEKFSVSEDSRK